jgi:hypothetical protein
MSEKTIPQIERRIARIKKALAGIGPMRPGSLTCQYKNPMEKTGPYWQISYTRQMRSRTEYVRTESVPEVRKQIAAYKRFKLLTDEWVNLSIELAKLRTQIEKEKASR